MLKREDFSQHAAEVVSWIDNYFKNIENYPVKSQVRPGEVYEKIPPEGPEGPETLQEILEDLSKTIMPGITHWQHPNFHAQGRFRISLLHASHHTCRLHHLN